MERRIVLLRGINLGPHNRIVMPELRELLSGAGYEDVETYVQSGNVVLASDDSPAALERDCQRLISERFGLDVPVIVRTHRELAQIVEDNPLAGVATDPKRYQVSFLARELDPRRVEELQSLTTSDERLVALGRELYAWHPGGVARSKLWAKLASAGLGVRSTARNWNTVEKLLAMASR